MLIDLATAWHREAIGTDTQPGTNDRGTMELATKLYRLILKNFPDMEQMEFPDIDKRDWPTEYKVSYYYAELLWKMENWAECGPAFDHVLEVDPQGEFTEDAAYASVLCYNKQYQHDVRGRREDGQAPREEGRRRQGQEEEGQGGRAVTEELVAKFKPKDFSPLETGMLNAYQRYVCFVPDSEDLPTIKYRRARIYYETNHFEEASVLFKDIAFNHPNSELGRVRGEPVPRLAQRPRHVQRAGAAGLLRRDERQHRAAVRAVLQDRPRRARSTPTCATCSSSCAATCCVRRRKRCSRSKEYKKAAQLYVRVFRKYRECGKLDEVLYNAAINFEAARLLGRAIKVRRVLIEQYPESEWSKRAIYLIGANFHALAMYDMAAEYYEKFADKYPSELGEKCTDAENKAGTCTERQGSAAERGLLPPRLGRRGEGGRRRQAVREELSQEVPARDLAGELLARLDLRAPGRLEQGDRPLLELHQAVQEDRAAARDHPGQRERRPRAT